MDRLLFMFGGGGEGGRGLKDFDSKINDEINLVPAKVL